MTLAADLYSHPGPTVPELQAIEAEWPVHAAHLALVGAQCRFAAQPDVLARRSLRRAEEALARAVVSHANAIRQTPNELNQGAPS